ncbi:hypothetical protein ONE63_011602 [Megalurothrips usitatus]|uniref:Uncharacterized protein n=1 Tax=Megalurothrips usitatus TaxID=439358 RepID=A0AAV7X439_9NEOP|nr:hypothetical protein ONE63_011602 [Megalurothrips usitatus]
MVAVLRSSGLVLELWSPADSPPGSPVSSCPVAADVSWTDEDVSPVPTGRTDPASSTAGAPGSSEGPAASSSLPRPADDLPPAPPLRSPGAHSNCTAAASSRTGHAEDEGPVGAEGGSGHAPPAALRCGAADADAPGTAATPASTSAASPGPREQETAGHRDTGAHEAGASGASASASFDARVDVPLADMIASRFSHWVNTRSSRVVPVACPAQGSAQDCGGAVSEASADPPSGSLSEIVTRRFFDMLDKRLANQFAAGGSGSDHSRDDNPL